MTSNAQYISDPVIVQYLQILQIDPTHYFMSELNESFEINYRAMMKKLLLNEKILRTILDYHTDKISKIDYLNKFSIEQTKYVTNLSESDTKLIACAGSGKTRTLLGRIRFMIDHNMCDKSEIFAITYSKSAAEDFKNKLGKLFDDYENIFIIKNFSTIDSIAKSILCKIKSNKSENVEILSISLRNYLLNISDSDIDLIKSFKNIKHLFVDEAQDLNDVQYDILQLLKIKFGTKIHLFGDPNQNIYQMRRSSSIYLTNFIADTYELTLNFRSSQQIINFSEHFKSIWTKKSVSAKNKIGPIVVIHHKKLDQIYGILLEFIKTYTKDLSQVAILCPTRGTKTNTCGLSLFFDLLKTCKIPTNQMYNEAGSNEHFTKSVERKPGHINLLTYHGSEGLEFDVVWVMDFYQNLWIRPPTASDHINNKYLLYVATSRAETKMFICGNIQYPMNGWMKNINEEYIQIFSPLYVSDKSECIKNIPVHGITQSINNLTDIQLNEIHDMLNIKIDHKHLSRKIFKDYSKINRQNSDALIGIFCDELYRLQYCLVNNLDVPQIKIIEKILKSKFIVINDDRIHSMVHRYIVLNDISWEIFEKDKYILPYELRTYMEKNLDKTKNLSCYLFFNNKFMEIIEKNKHHIQNAYDRYLNPIVYNYSYKKIIDDFFYLILVRYAYNINHYTYIDYTDTDKKFILNNYKELFDDMHFYIKHFQLNKIEFKPYVEYDKLLIQGEIDLIEHHNDPNCKNKFTIVEIKCCSEISMKHYLQLLLYNFCYCYMNKINENLGGGFKIINLLTGTEHLIYVMVSSSNMFKILNMIATVSNLNFHKLNLVYDLETTGFITENLYPDIIEISIKDYDSGLTIIDSLITSTKLTPLITTITGITNDQLQNKPTMDEIRQILLVQTKNLKQCIMLAHNGAHFDDKIIRHHQIIDQSIISSCIDTMHLIPMHLPLNHTLKSKSLSSIYFYLFNINFNAHRSMSDVNALIKIMKYLNIKI